MDEPVVDTAAPAPPKKSKRWLVIVAAILVVVAAGGGGAVWLLSGTDAHAASRLEDRGLVSLADPFLVNLSDPGGARFLKASVQLVVASHEDAEHIEKTPIVLMHLRSAILELLTQQVAAELVTAEGKQALKKAIAERLNSEIAPRKVIDVLFSEFVVQF